MKKATFLISFVISLTAINAQTILEPINSYQNTSLGTGIIPGNYSSTQKAQLYHISHSSQEDITINILNPKFECIKSITQSIEAVTGHNSVYDKQQVLAAICTKTDSIQCTFTSYKYSNKHNHTRNVLTGYEIDTDHVSSSEARYTPELASKYLRELTGEQISVENENGIYTFLPSSSSKYYLYNQFDNAYPLW
ncbi:MAG: hypothetical protein K2M65_07130, partial [Muribaculaceae bacterium]|nr:hypothetical protein [Muribaculaceae bacterium]